MYEMVSETGHLVSHLSRFSPSCIAAFLLLHMVIGRDILINILKAQTYKFYGHFIYFYCWEKSELE